MSVAELASRFHVFGLIFFSYSLFYVCCSSPLTFPSRKGGYVANVFWKAWRLFGFLVFRVLVGKEALGM